MQHPICIVLCIIPKFEEQHLFIKILVNSIVWKWLCSQFTSYNLSAAKGFGLKYEGICFLQADCTIVGVYA